jgi:magnesium transporter
MIVAHINRQNLESHDISMQNQHLLKEAVWIDMLSPTKEEKALVDRILNLDIPTSEDMVKIELSRRLYRENGVLFMTSTMISNSDTDQAQLDPVSFVLTNTQLITVRFVDPKTFAIFTAQLKAIDASQYTAPILLAELLKAAVNRLADILAIVGQHLDDYSTSIFAPAVKRGPKTDYRKSMRELGYCANLGTKGRESLLAFDRLISFLQQFAGARVDEDHGERLTTIAKDIHALSSHAEFLTNKINYLLAATLGNVNITQNNIIKIFSIAAVIFMPPTLIASIYGMNFDRASHFNMPELGWKYGYVYSLTIMIISPFLLFRFFKSRGWF